jgi:hypothetical protein
MSYRLKLWRGLFKRDVASYQLHKAEIFYGVWGRVVLLLFCSAVIYGVSGLLGIGTEPIVKEIPNTGLDKIYIKLSLFTLGKMFAGIVIALFLLFAPTLIYWSLTDIPYRKLVIIQTFVLMIFLLERVANILLMYVFHLPWFSSPLSLGVVAQTLELPTLVIYLAGGISIFFVLSIKITYDFLKQLTDTSRVKVLLMVVCWHVFLLLTQTILAFVDVSTLFS